MGRQQFGGREEPKSVEAVVYGNDDNVGRLLDPMVKGVTFRVAEYYLLRGCRRVPALKDPSPTLQDFSDLHGEKIKRKARTSPASLDAEIRKPRRIDDIGVIELSC
ncbi:liver carboxylesterase-like isoform 1 [Moniliophthora roreri]|nr:liver carboxylesterase-like isoform 1 [Moniliophthora roreri]